jgi:hypothetical protein
MAAVPILNVSGIAHFEEDGAEACLDHRLRPRMVYRSRWAMFVAIAPPGADLSRLTDRYERFGLCASESERPLLICMVAAASLDTQGAFI